jgi:hypothetical protein
LDGDVDGDGDVNVDSDGWATAALRSSSCGRSPSDPR